MDTSRSDRIVIRFHRLLRDMPDDEERNKPERKREETRDRDREDGAMTGDPDKRLGKLDNALEAEEYPTTTNELVEAYGDYDIETQHGTETLEEVLTLTDDQTFDSPDDVRSRILGLIHR